ncbi:VOC family protein [Planktotalea sp.]|uniref:VOC family protein n=1 Tax=Planktotalea sp. TaxID=2029877 RepID=UPI003D6A93BF
MQLGAFSISLAVKDLSKSIAFYEDLGFSNFSGTQDHGYVIMKNSDTLIGLFQGMFEQNMLTFNPGWDQNAAEIDPFEDVRALRETLAKAGHTIEHEGGGESGPASFVVTDLDGNPILIDQHR